MAPKLAVIFPTVGKSWVSIPLRSFSARRAASLRPAFGAMIRNSSLPQRPTVFVTRVLVVKIRVSHPVFELAPVN